MSKHVNVFDSVVLSILCKYLSIAEITSLWLSCNRFQHLLDPRFFLRQSVLKKFDEYKISYRKLQDIFQDTECILSGSFVLSMLNGQDYSSSNPDLDIFMMHSKDNDKKVFDYIAKMNQLSNTRANRLFTYYPGAMKIRELFVGTIKLQFILLDPKIHPNLIEFVKTFDLDFCKNAFSLNGDKLFIYNLDNILQSQCKLQLYNHIKNYKKYFKFDETLIIQNILKRIVKYSNRGFQIEIIDPKDLAKFYLG